MYKMEGAIKAFLESEENNIYIKIEKRRKVLTFQNIFDYDEESSFKLTNKKISAIIELLKESKQKINLDIKDYEFDNTYLRQILANLNISHVYHGSIEIIKYANVDHTFWYVKISYLDLFSSIYKPYICICVSGYHIFVGFLSKGALIRFELQVGEKNVTKDYKISGITNRIVLFIKNEKIDVKYMYGSNVQDDYTKGHKNLLDYSIGIHDFKCMRLDFVIVNGLGGRGKWSDFLMRGLYDPRLFLLVAAFFDENFCY